MYIKIEREDLLKLFDLDIEFNEEYRRGVNETWGGRAVAVYELLYKALHEVRDNKMLLPTFSNNTYEYPLTYAEAYPSSQSIQVEQSVMYISS